MKPGDVRICLLGAATVLLAACSVGPDYVRPEVETPSAYKEAAAVWKVAEPKDHLNRGKWWEMFGDPVLSGLMEQVSISNQNVQLAEAQFRQARALVHSARAAFFPSVSGAASVTRSRSPTGSSRTVETRGPLTDYSLSLDAAWEADVWGRVRRSVEASEAGFQASAGDLESIRLSAQAELAQDYFQLRALDEQRRLFDESVAAYEKSLGQTRNRYAAGVAAKADVVQAQTQLRSTQAQGIDLGVQRAQLEHAIALLIGKPPSDFTLEPAPLSAVVPSIPVGVPSELLERRPDVAAAERRVAAANAQIGLAKAAYFPEITLSAGVGFESLSFARWLTVPNRFWSIGPALAQSLFDGGLRRAQSEQAIAAYDGTVATYRQTVLSGFQQVEDNLAALRLLEQEAQVQDEAVQAAREAVQIGLNQYKAGTVSYLEVVILQTLTLNNERTAVSVLGRRLSAAVALVRGLGGGWDGELPASAAAVDEGMR